MVSVKNIILSVLFFQSTQVTYQRSHAVRSRAAKMMGRMTKFHKSGHCLDRRPSNLKVTGFVLEEKDDVLAALAVSFLPDFSTRYA